MLLKPEDTSRPGGNAGLVFFQASLNAYMVLKARFSKSDLVKVLGAYDLGEYVSHRALTEGIVQTNLALKTTKGKFVFRYYEIRPRDYAPFETNTLRYLIPKIIPLSGCL